MKKEQLFLLIKSLSKGEKSYFKKFSSRHTAHGKNNYIKLFDVIDKQKEYDEEKIKAKLKTEAVIKNLSSAKFYLLGLIIKCLTSFHSDEGVDYKIKELMQSIEILGKKNLHDLRLTMLEKAKELALKYERYPLLIELLFMEKNILIILSDVKMLEKFYERFHSDVVKYSELIINSTKVWTARNKLVSAQIVAGRNREEEKGILMDDVFKNEITPLDAIPLTFDARRNLMSACFFYYIYRNDFVTSYVYTKKAVDMWETKMDMASQELPRYMVSLQNHLLACVNVCRWDEFDQVMGQLKSVPKRFAGDFTEEMKLNIFNALHLELDKFGQAGNFTEAIKHVPEIEKGLIELKGKYNKEFEIVTLYNVACMYFGAGEFKTALRWTRKIIDSSPPEIRTDLQAITRMVNIMIYIELGDSDMLESQLRSTSRFLKKRKKLYKVESLMLNFFKIFFKSSGNKKRLEKFQNLKMELEEAAKNPDEMNIFNDFDYISWVESKITKRSYEELVQEKAKIRQAEMELQLKAKLLQFRMPQNV